MRRWHAIFMLLHVSLHFFLERGLPDLIGAWNLYFHRETHTLDNEQESDFFSSDDRFLIFIYLFTFVKKEMHCIAQIRREIVNFVPLNISFHFTKKKNSLNNWCNFSFSFCNKWKRKREKKIRTEKAKVKECPLCVIQKSIIMPRCCSYSFIKVLCICVIRLRGILWVYYITHDDDDTNIKDVC